jgi:hypothetical protein
LKLFGIIATLFLAFAFTAQAQITIPNPTFVNMGATVTVTGGARLHISGHAEVRAGRIDVLDLGRMTIEGSCSIWQGGVYFFQDATGVIKGDLEIRLDGTCWRYRPGILTVEGTIYNDGALNNDGEINIGR